MDKELIIEAIQKSITSKKEELKQQYEATKTTIGYFYIDDLLPVDLTEKCYQVFPKKEDMRMLKSIREYKYVSAQMNQHDSLLEDVLYAFQDKRIVNLVNEICNVNEIYPDESLYAGGVSLMSKDNFLKPHLDNSHDANRERWRVLNLLFYVTPDWKLEDGGHLELWPEGTNGKPILIESKFNRLVVMATHDASWHSVNKVMSNSKDRCCISNYYFSKHPLKETDKFHVTTYSGRPEDKLSKLFLSIDANLRMFVRKVFKKGIRKNPHYYKKNG